jgi:hypothetical protein
MLTHVRDCLRIPGRLTAVVNVFVDIDRIHSFQECMLALTANWSDAASALRFHVFSAAGYQVILPGVHVSKP